MQTDVHISQVFFRKIVSCTFFLGMEKQKIKESCKVFVTYVDVSGRENSFIVLFFSVSVDMDSIKYNTLYWSA